jgi:hypothetical protein
VDEHDWIEHNAAQIRRVLARCEVRAELAALLGGDDRRRERRLEAARRELASMELRLKLEEEEPWI